MEKPGTKCIWYVGLEHRTLLASATRISSFWPSSLRAIGLVNLSACICFLRDKFIHILSFCRPKLYKFYILNQLLRCDEMRLKAISCYWPYTKRFTNIIRTIFIGWIRISWSDNDTIIWGQPYNVILCFAKRRPTYTLQYMCLPRSCAWLNGKI